MLKRVASKRTTLLLNKLNKSSAIHPGPAWSPVHVDQRLPAHTGATTEQGPRRKELCTNAAATPAQKTPPSPAPTAITTTTTALPLLPSWSINHTSQRGGGWGGGGVKRGWAAPGDLTSFLWMAQLLGRRWETRWCKLSEHASSFDGEIGGCGGL